MTLRGDQNYFRYLEEKLGIPVDVTERKFEIGYHESVHAESVKTKLLLQYTNRRAELDKQIADIQKQIGDLQEEYRVAIQATRKQ